MTWQNFSLQYQYNIKQTSDENKEKYQLGDYKLMQYQILHANITRTVWQTIRRITNEILGVKRLRGCYHCRLLIKQLFDQWQGRTFLQPEPRGVIIDVSWQSETFFSSGHATEEGTGKKQRNDNRRKLQRKKFHQLGRKRDDMQIMMTVKRLDELCHRKHLHLKYVPLRQN